MSAAFSQCLCGVKSADWAFCILNRRVYNFRSHIAERKQRLFGIRGRNKAMQQTSYGTRFCFVFALFFRAVFHGDCAKNVVWIVQCGKLQAK